MPVTHLELIKRRPNHTIFTSLCNRLANGTEQNTTDKPEEVTCKFCLKKMAPR